VKQWKVTAEAAVWAENEDEAVLEAILLFSKPEWEMDVEELKE